MVYAEILSSMSSTNQEHDDFDIAKKRVEQIERELSSKMNLPQAKPVSNGRELSFVGSNRYWY